MKRTIQGVVLAASLLTGGISLAQDAATKGPMQGKPMTKGGMTEYRGFMAPTDEKALLERLHHSNQQEMKLARLAQQNSTNPDVKSFADMMIKDHTAMDQKLMTYAQGKGMKLADEPKPMNDIEKRVMASNKAAMEELQVLKGMPFDSTYMAGQVAAHDMVLGKVMAAKQAMPATGEVASMLNELSQKVPAHREQALQVLGKLDDAMGVGGSGTGMNGSSGSMGHDAMQHGSQGKSGVGMGGNTGSTPPTPTK